MILFSNKRTLQEYFFIHIPKASGTIIRRCITNKHRYKKGFWGIDKKKELDLAHIPYILADKYFKLDINNRYVVAFLRDPYQRFISGYRHMKSNSGKTVDDFRYFIKNELEKIIFDNRFNYRIIHIYPMYRFLENNDGKIQENFILTKLEEYDSKTNLIKIPDFNISKYNIDEYYDNECLKIINKVYEKDFELFGYKKILLN